MAAPKPSEPPKPEDVQQKNTLARSGLLRANHGFISEAGFRQRRAYFAGKVREYVLQEQRPGRQDVDSETLIALECSVCAPPVWGPPTKQCPTRHRRGSCSKPSPPRV